MVELCVNFEKRGAGVKTLNKTSATEINVYFTLTGMSETAFKQKRQLEKAPIGRLSDLHCQC